MKLDVQKSCISYTALNDDELSLSVGAIVNVINRNLEDDGWWQGELDGKIGVFPDNFVELCRTYVIVLAILFYRI